MLFPACVSGYEHVFLLFDFTAMHVCKYKRGLKVEYIMCCAVAQLHNVCAVC